LRGTGERGRVKLACLEKGGTRGSRGRGGAVGRNLTPEGTQKKKKMKKRTGPQEKNERGFCRQNKEKKGRETGSNK